VVDGRITDDQKIEIAEYCNSKLDNSHVTLGQWAQLTIKTKLCMTVVKLKRYNILVLKFKEAHHTYFV